MYLRQEAGSPLSELLLPCVEAVKVVCLPLLSILEMSACSALTQRRAHPQGVITLLLFPVISLSHPHPSAILLLLTSLATPGFMLFRNVSSWNPGNIFMFSFLLHLPFSVVVGPSQFSLSQVSSLHSTTKEVMKRQEDPSEVHGNLPCCAWSQAQLHCKHKNPTGLKISVR